MRYLLRAWQLLGIGLFWLAWPVLFFYLRQNERTRLVVVASGTILVVKNWLGNGKWSLPGGGMNHNEVPADAVQREVKEELGLALTPDKIELLTTSPYRSNGFRFNCHYFKAVLPWQAPLKPTFPEIFETGWLDPKMLSTKNANADVITAVQTLSSQNLLQ